VTQVVVVIGGGGLSARAVAAAQPGAVVLAADSGYDHAVAAGLQPSMVVGDLDSISEAGRADADRRGVRVQQHPVAKDLTDTELAIATALDVDGATDLLVLGGTDTDDQRLDHLLGTLLALGNPRLAALGTVQAVLGDSAVTVVHAGRTAALPFEAGRTFSLLALHGPVAGVHLEGALWELNDDTLWPHEARGVSNVANGPVRAWCTSGVLTVVAP